MEAINTATLIHDPVISELLNSCAAFEAPSLTDSKKIALEFRALIEKAFRSQVVITDLAPCNYNAIKLQLVTTYGEHEFSKIKTFVQSTLQEIDERVEKLAGRAHAAETHASLLSPEKTSKDIEEVAHVEQVARATSSSREDISNVSARGFLWKIVGEFGNNYFVGRKKESLFVSYSREYAKEDREPLAFVLDSTDDLDDGYMSTNVESYYGQGRIRVFTFDPSCKYLGQLYRDKEGYLKILPDKCLNPSIDKNALVWVALDAKQLGHGKQLMHHSALNLYHYSDKGQFKVVIEKRFFLGGEGDGLNSDYLVAVSANPSARLQHFEIKDPFIVPKLKASVSRLKAEVDESQLKLEAMSLQHNEFKTMSQAEKNLSHDIVNEQKESMRELHDKLAGADAQHRDELAKSYSKVKSLKKQRNLLKREVLTLREQMESAKLAAEKETKLLLVEVETLRSQLLQLRHTSSISAAPDKPNVDIEDEGQDGLDPPDANGVSFTPGAPSAYVNPPLPPRPDMTPSAQAKVKSKTKFRLTFPKLQLHSTKNTAELLNANSEISLLKSQLGVALEKNESLEKSLLEKSRCIEDLSKKMHELLVQIAEKASN